MAFFPFFRLIRLPRKAHTEEGQVEMTNPTMTEDEWCEEISRRTGIPVEKVRRVRQIARGHAVTFRDEDEYMRARWLRFERPELYPEG